MTLLWSKNQNPVFLSFGVSAITLLLINLFINVTYFWNRLLNAHLLTYQTVPSSIFDFLVENHYIFYIYIKLAYLQVKFVKKLGGNNFSLHWSVRWNECIKYSDFRLVWLFFGPKRQKDHKCLMGLFDTSKDAHSKDDFKNM